MDEIDLREPAEKPKPGFAVHVITVTKVAYAEAADKFGIYPTELEYEIDHGGCGWRDEECLVESTVQDLGLHAAMFGIWDKGKDGNLLQVGDYRVRGWVTKYPATPNGPEEYDAGIELVGQDEVDDDAAV